VDVFASVVVRFASPQVTVAFRLYDPATFFYDCDLTMQIPTMTMKFYDLMFMSLANRNVATANMGVIFAHVDMALANRHMACAYM
jgi:hypothetical protein